MEYIISSQDKEILRDLAKKQLEYAKKEENLKRIDLWYKHNDLKGERPMIHLEMGTFSKEIIPQRMACQGEFERWVERSIYFNFLNQELFDDDRVTPDYFPLSYYTYFKPFDIDISVDKTTDSSGKESVGHHFKSIVEDLEEDYHKLKKSVFGADLSVTLKQKQVIEDAIGDILPVKIQMDSLYSVPTQDVVHFMSMENMMFAMYDYPELFKEMMDRMAQDTLEYFDMLEEKRLIMPTVSFEALAQGSWCFTNQLPSYDEYEKRPFTTKDVWGFMDSQETVGISPEMFEEFIFPCYKKISERYGLLSYGCCEPVDPIWERCISKLENLRKVSISPWCNEEYMGERLKNSNIIYHRKPSPNFLGVGANLDEDKLRQHFRNSLNAAKGCKMEFTQRDVYTINNDIPKAKRYIEILRQEIENHYQP